MTGRVTLLGALLAGSVGFGPSSCVIAADPEDVGQPLYPLIRDDDSTDHLTIEFGNGQLRTTSNESWWGIDSLAFPNFIESRHTPVVVQVHGLNLSGIGDLLWPPDTTDVGATVLLSLGGPRDLKVQMSSALVRPEFPQGPRDRPTATEPKHHAFVFMGRSYLGWYASRAFKMDPSIPSSPPTRATFDLRVRYDNRSVAYWVREHKSPTKPLRRGGSACATDPEMNTPVVRKNLALSGRGCWTVPTIAIERGDWIFGGERKWEEADTSLSMSLTLLARNWLNADGPYYLTWNKLMISGVSDPEIARAVGRGEFAAVASGSLTTLTPFQEKASFSLVATQDKAADQALAAFRFRAGDLEIASLRIDWSLLRRGTVSFGGDATVNDLRGFRFEVSAFDGGDGDRPDKLRVSLFSASNAYTVPVYRVAADLPSDAISVRAPD